MPTISFDIQIQIPLNRAKRMQLSETAYLAAVADRANVEKYYEYYTDTTGKRKRRRREGLFPPTMRGLHRAVRDLETQEILFYEKK